MENENIGVVTSQLKEFPHTIIDLEFPRHVFEGAKPEDVPMLHKLAMTMSTVSWETLPETVRSLARVSINENETEYTLNVRMPADREIDFDSMHAVWDATPTNLVALLLGPWKDPETSVIYMNVNAVVRATHSPISGRFRMLQRYTRTLRQSRSALAASHDGHSARQLLLKAKESESRAEKRQPWRVIKNEQDRNVAHSIIMLCKDMSGGIPGDAFWSSITVRENIPGRPDRIVVTWRLQENTLLDALIGATLRIKHPGSIEKISFRLSPDRSRDCKWCPVIVEIVLYSVACDVLSVTESSTVNLFSSMRNSSATMNSIKICGPSQCTKDGEGCTDPALSAEQTIGDDRSYQPKRAREEESHLLETEESLECMRPAKISRTHSSFSSVEQKRKRYSDANVGFLGILKSTLGL